MEIIESNIEDLTVQQMRLCPECYLVVWSDGDGQHFGQGVPVEPELSLPVM